jgi:hypothetical protein
MIAVIMTFRELLNKFSLDELWYYLSMRHGLQSKPIKAGKLRELYGSARDELLALELNQGEICGELSCDFCADKTDEWNEMFFNVSLKEAEEIFAAASGNLDVRKSRGIENIFHQIYETAVLIRGPLPAICFYHAMMIRYGP